MAPRGNQKILRWSKKKKKKKWRWFRQLKKKSQTDHTTGKQK